MVPPTSAAYGRCRGVEQRCHTLEVRLNLLTRILDRSKRYAERRVLDRKHGQRKRLLSGSFGMHSRTRANDDDRSPAAVATHSELGVNTIARCRPVKFDGMATNAKPVPGERLPDNFQLSDPHRPGDNFHLSVPLSNAFLDRSTFHGREQSWPKLQCLRTHLAKTTATGRKFGQNSNSRCRCKFHFKNSTGERRLRFSARLLSQSTQSLRVFGTGAIYMNGPRFATSNLCSRSES
jgi:hypothetical protein